MNRDHATGGRRDVLVKTVIVVSAAVAIFAGVAVGTIATAGGDDHHERHRDHRFA